MKDQPEINSSNDSNRNNHNHNHNPLRFLDTIDEHKHIVLFYENPESGRMIQFRFLKNGLLNGQVGIYSTHKETDISLIENEMTTSGLDIDEFKKKKLLYFRQVPDPRNYREGSVIAYDKIVNDILTELKDTSVFHIVLRVMPEVMKEDQIVDELDVERTLHSTFGSFGGSLLCSYSVEEIEPRKRGKWIAELLQNHHAAIFIPKSGDGIAFNLE
jgi:hypothetical protein